MPFRTVVTFRSESFNTTVVRPYFVSVNSFGDDAAQHIVYELQRHGIHTGDPVQEDFGWYFRFEVDGKAHLFVLGYRPVEGDWLGNIERVPILLVKPRVHPHAPTVIHAAVSDESVFQHVRWHVAAQFDRGEEDDGTAQP
jgi:hypothetical protein